MTASLVIGTVLTALALGLMVVLAYRQMRRVDVVRKLVDRRMGGPEDEEA